METIGIAHMRLSLGFRDYSYAVSGRYIPGRKHLPKVALTLVSPGSLAAGNSVRCHEHAQNFRVDTRWKLTRNLLQGLGINTANSARHILFSASSTVSGRNSGLKSTSLSLCWALLGAADQSLGPSHSSIPPAAFRQGSAARTHPS